MHNPTALYRTRITHLRRAPVHHYFEHHGYSWYVDIDQLPRLPRWLRPFARFDARDHLDGAPRDSLRQRVDAFLAAHGIDLTDGSVTALMQARVLGYGYYLVRAPRPNEALDVAVSLHRDDEPPFVVTLRGVRRRANVSEVLRLQAVAPLAPLMSALEFRVQRLTLWLRGVPVVPRGHDHAESPSCTAAFMTHRVESRLP